VVVVVVVVDGVFVPILLGHPVAVAQRPLHRHHNRWYD
jgi:hypothetical protein